MSLKTVSECERKRVSKYSNISLPNSYNKLGIAITAVAFLALLVLGFIENEPEILRDLIKKLILVGLLVVSISKDKEEDELTQKLKTQSYTMAFVFGVLYAVIQPYITYFIALLIGKENKLEFLQLGDFQLLFFMLVIQIGFYRMLKKYR